MALEDQTLAITLAQGVDTKTSSKQVVAGKLITLENGFFQTPQEIRKAYGFSALSSPGGSAAGLSLDPYANELLTAGYTSGSTYPNPNSTASYLYSYSSQLNTWRFVNTYYPGLITSKLIDNPGQSNGSTQAESRTDSAYDSSTGTYCYIWKDSATRFSIVDKTTGAKIVDAARLGESGGSGAISTSVSKVVSFNGYFVIIYVNSGDNKLYYLTVQASSPTAVNSPVLISANINTTNSSFDATVYLNRIYIGFNYVTTGVSFLYIDSSFVISSATTDTTAAATKCISLWGASSSVWSAFSNGTNVYGIILTTSLGVQHATAVAIATANVNQITGVFGPDSNNYFFYCVYTNNGVTGTFAVNNTYIGAMASNATATGTLLMNSVAIGSKPFVYRGAMHLALHYCDLPSGQPTGFIVSVIPDAAHGVYFTYVTGKFAASDLYDISHLPNLPEFFQVSTGIYQTTYTQTIGGQEIGLGGGTSQLVMDFTYVPQTAQIANTLHISGSQLWMYDSKNLVEHSFHLYPANMSSVVTATGAIAEGSYEYVCVYEWLDNNGQLHRSAPSLPLTVTVAAGGASNIAVTVSTLAVTNKSNVIISFYRTNVNGTIFYFATSMANTPTTNTVTFNDGNVTISTSHTELYTTGGQVENSSAPPCLALSTYKSRLIVIPSDNPYSWWFSQEVVPNSASSSATPVELSESFIENIDENGGPLTGAIQMDDKLILSKGTVPYYVVGDGPAPNGTNNNFSPPQLITSPVGCGTTASLVSVPLGIMFQAANSAGLWLLDRSLSTSYIGADVEAYNSQTVTSSVLYSNYNQVRFSMSGGVILAYDYYMKQWTVLTNHTAVQACLFQGAYSYVKSDGTILKENTSVFTNNGAFVSLKIVTSWLQFANIQGFQRVKQMAVIGAWKSAHTLLVKLAYDFSSTYVQTATIASETSLVPYQYEVSPAIQKCEAIQILIQDQNSGTPGESMSLTSLNFIAGVKKGQQKLPPTQTF